MWRSPHYWCMRDEETCSYMEKLYSGHGTMVTGGMGGCWEVRLSDLHLHWFVIQHHNHLVIAVSIVRLSDSWHCFWLGVVQHWDRDSRVE
jgi:hypothetical protein